MSDFQAFPGCFPDKSVERTGPGGGKGRTPAIEAPDNLVAPKRRLPGPKCGKFRTFPGPLRDRRVGKTGHVSPELPDKSVESGGKLRTFCRFSGPGGEPHPIPHFFPTVLAKLSIRPRAAGTVSSFFHGQKYRGLSEPPDRAVGTPGQFCRNPVSADRLGGTSGQICRRRPGFAGQNVDQKSTF